MPTTLGNLDDLGWLTVSGNQLTTFPESLGKLTGLKGIDLSFSGVTEAEKETVRQLLPNCEVR